MTATLVAGELAAASTADDALLAVTDALTGCGYSVRCPALDGSPFMQIANARAALSDLTITAYGTVLWEYRTFDGSHVDPAHIAAVALGLLDPDHHRARPGPPPRRSDVTLTCAGDALTAKTLGASPLPTCPPPYNSSRPSPALPEPRLTFRIAALASRSALVSGR